MHGQFWKQEGKNRKRVCWEQFIPRSDEWGSGGNSLSSNVSLRTGLLNGRHYTHVMLNVDWKNRYWKMTDWLNREIPFSSCHFLQCFKMIGKLKLKMRANFSNPHWPPCFFLCLFVSCSCSCHGNILLQKFSPGVKLRVLDHAFRGSWDWTSIDVGNLQIGGLGLFGHSLRYHLLACASQRSKHQRPFCRNPVHP